MTGTKRIIESSRGGTFSAYLATPEGGSGPGLVLAHEIFGANATMRAAADLFAEEGYVVLVPDLFWRLEPGVELGYDVASIARAMSFFARFDFQAGVADLADSVAWLRAAPECTGGVGLLGYCLGGTLSYCAAHEGVVDVAVSYYPVGLAERLSQYPKKVTVPLVMHFGDADAHIPIQEIESLSATLAGAPDAKAFVYRDAGRAFATPGRDSYQKSSARLAHSRTIAVLRRVLGPVFDLEAIWDAHLACEFVRRDADATLDTMSSEPYVNHIPTLTGGVGRRDLHYFYARHFIPKTPPDFRMIPISRTVGADRIVDEGVGCFTHTTEFDFLLPGIPPTGRYVEVPSVLVVSFRGGKLQHEHIYWDQASVLVQVGLLDATGLPVTGREQATKALDEGSIPSNELLPTWRK